MSHPLVSEGFHYHGFPLQGAKAIYVRTIIDPSVIHVQALGEAIRRWNEVVGARILLAPDKGEYTVTFLEKGGNESPFKEYPGNGGLTFLHSGNPKVYLRSDLGSTDYRDCVHIWSHEIGHTFGLADHPKENISSVMSYQVQGWDLLSPSQEDVQSIAKIHGLADMRVRVEELDGSENVTGFWNWDRFEGLGWRVWFPPPIGTYAIPNRIKSLVVHEQYIVRVKVAGLLGLREQLAVLPGQYNRWRYG